MVNSDIGDRDRSQAIKIMVSSLGLNQDSLKRLRVVLDEIAPNSGSALLGVVIGLWISDSVNLRSEESLTIWEFANIYQQVCGAR